MELVVVRGRRDMKPLLLKLGVALALSFAGFLVSRLRSATNSGRELEPGGKPAGGGRKDELRTVKSDEALAKIINGTSTTTITTTTTTTFVGLSPTSWSSGDEDGFLLPEFNDLVMKEFEAPGRDPETASTTHAPRNSKTKQGAAMEQEIVHLSNLMRSLHERNRSLKLAVRELQSQLRINTVEARLSSLKIESLQAENRRLQDQLSDHSRMMHELEAARTKLRLLKRKMSSDGEQARETTAALLHRISLLQVSEQNHGRDDVEFEKLNRLQDFQDEAMNIKMVNSKFMRKLEAPQTHRSPVLQNPEAEVSAEAEQLREANDKLAKETERLRTDRCADVEELVYLRWVNACRRHELRNFQPPHGKPVARDLSESLSPNSEKKAKQLILEYADTAGDEKNMDFDSEDYASSQASAGEPEDTPDVSTARSSTSRKSN